MRRLDCAYILMPETADTTWRLAKNASRVNALLPALQRYPNAEHAQPAFDAHTTLWYLLRVSQSVNKK